MKGKDCESEGKRMAKRAENGSSTMEATLRVRNGEEKER